MAKSVTVVSVEDHILEEFYMNVGDSLEGNLQSDMLSDEDQPKLPETLFNMTMCVIVMKNGFVVTGESACADSAKFNQQIGERLAREDAIRKVWNLLGYVLREELHQEEIAA